MRIFTPTLGGKEIAIYAPEVGRFDLEAFRAAFPSGALYGLDVESTFMDELAQFSPDFEVRLIQFGTKTFAWVLTLADPAQRAAAIELLLNPQVSFCSHTPMDVLAVHTQLGVDITGRNVDTRMLASMAAPDDQDGGKDLKTLAGVHVGGELQDAEKALEDRFTQLWLASDPDRKHPADDVIQAYGWANIPLDDEVYLTYAGLDAVACRRIVDILIPLTSAPPELLRTEIWMAGAANRICIRGARVDMGALKSLKGESEGEAADVRARVTRLTVADPIRECRSWDSWSETKRAQGLSPLSPMLRPHTRNKRGPDGKALKKPSGKGYITEHCCNGWLAQHGADWSTWDDKGGSYTSAGLPSLEKDNIQRLDQFVFDPVGRAVVDQMQRYRRHHDALSKMKGIAARVDSAGRVHPTLNTLGAVTGRMTSSAPNFQNFSKKNPLMRGLFVPEPGHVLMTADFDQIELRVVAALAKEQKMIDVILSPPPHNDLHQLTVDELAASGIVITRDTAKMVNFLIVYGGGGRALSEQAGIPLAEAQRIVATFRERYQAIARLTREMAQFRDEVRTISHRRVPVTTNSMGDLRTYANINSLVQSSARDLLGDAWWRFEHEFGRGHQVWFLIHDEMVLQVREEEEEQVTKEIQRCMRFDFMGVPISASAVTLRDEDGTSRWMTSKRSELIIKAKASARELCLV